MSVDLPGSKQGERGRNWGIELAKKFPEQDALDFCYACAANGYGPADSQAIVNLDLVEAPSPFDPAWAWRVTLVNGTTWLVEGSCDFTGWDCSSWLEWTEEP